MQAVKEDLIRCCATKFEMHWETNDAVIIGAKNEGLYTYCFHYPTSLLMFLISLVTTESQTKWYIKT